MRSVKSKSWSNQEDKHLAQLVDQKIRNQKKLAWNQVAEEMKGKIQNFNKIGKQCRQRWTNHLNPAVKKNDEWSPEQNQILITLHSELGNKWSEISKRIPGRTDNCIKNHFNSLMRNGFRKINDYIREVKRKQVLVKIFKNQLLDKVLTFCEGKNDDKFQYTIEAKQLAHDIKTKFALISCDKAEDNLQLKEKLFNQICEFKRHCRRKKMKKVNSDDDSESGDRIKQKKQKQKKNEKCSESNRYQSSLQPTPQVKEQQPVVQNQRLALFVEDAEKMKNTGVASQALKQLIQHQNEEYNIPIKQEESASGYLQRSNLLNSGILGSRLISQFSNYYTQNTASGLFNFVPAYQELEQQSAGFLSTVQDLSKQKNFRGQLDFNNKPPELLEQLIEEGEIQLGFGFSNAFQSPFPNEPLTGSIPYTNSSGFNFLSTNMGKQQQQLKLKILRNDVQPNQSSQLQQQNKSKTVVKSLSL